MEYGLGVVVNDILIHVVSLEAMEFQGKIYRDFLVEIYNF